VTHDGKCIKQVRPAYKSKSTDKRTNFIYRGRNGEGGAEDPFLMSELATAWTLGLQHSDLDPNHLQVAVTLKHFAVNTVESTIGWSDKEAGGSWTRHNISANISGR
jgi:hypothetical protein